MRDDVELVDAGGAVLVEGRLGEWMHAKASGTAVTACIDLGHELLLSQLPPSHDARPVLFNDPDHPLDGWA